VALLLIGPHLQTLYRSECLRLETGKTVIEQSEWNCVVYSTVERGVRPTLTAQGRAMDGCDCDLPQKMAAISWPLRRSAIRRRIIAPKKNDGSQFGLVQRCDGARHIHNSFR